MIRINDVMAKFPKRTRDSHKGDFGHVLVIAGSYGYTGAAYLASQAAIVSGSGLVTLAVGKSIYDIMAAKLTEVMVRPFFETKDASLSLLAEKDILNFSEKCDCIAIGPGISQNKETQTLVRNLAGKLEKDVILDADGINAFTGNPAAIKERKAGLVITPHPGEMSRLTGLSVDEIQKDRIGVALKFAAEYNSVLALKGSQTVVAGPDGRSYVNDTGNVGMATAGSGDVLTGMIAGFAAQGVELFDAAVLGVYIHGLAGDIAVKERGILGLVASDLLNKLPEALKALA